MSDQQIPSEILQLPVAERIELVHRIWDSIAESGEAIQPSEDQQQLFEQRMDELERFPERLTEANDAIRELMDE